MGGWVGGEGKGRRKMILGIRGEMIGGRNEEGDMR